MTNNTSNAVLIQGVTVANIEAIVERAVERRISAFYERVKSKPPVLVKRKEAARMLGISLPTIDGYSKAGILHARHVGGRVYFEEEEIKNYKK